MKKAALIVALSLTISLATIASPGCNRGDTTSTGMTGLALEAALQTTHAQMPNIMLDSVQRANLVAYLDSLRPRKE